MFGEGLTWEESVPAQVGAMMETQSANLAVDGFGTDQAYLRLQMELARFRRPVAVVSLFMTALFGRNLDDDRPHLGPELVWLKPEQHSRLISIARLVVQDFLAGTYDEIAVAYPAFVSTLTQRPTTSTLARSSHDKRPDSRIVRRQGALPAKATRE